MDMSAESTPRFAGAASSVCPTRSARKNKIPLSDGVVAGAVVPPAARTVSWPAPSYSPECLSPGRVHQKIPLGAPAARTASWPAPSRGTPRGASPPTSARLVDPLTHAVRAAVREELRDVFAEGRAARSAMREELRDAFAEGEHARGAVRGEVEAALQGWRGPARVARSTSSWPLSPKSATGREPEPFHSHSRQSSFADGADVADADDQRVRRMASAKINHVSEFVRGVKSVSVRYVDFRKEDEETAGKGLCGWRIMMQKVKRLLDWLRNLEEPPHTGCLARFVAGRVFDAAVCFTIFINCAFMVYSANVEIQDPNHMTAEVRVGDLFFQALYTLEMTIKLIVHRQWFFCNTSWKVNLFDFAVVIAGFYSAMGASEISGGALRLARMLRYGKALHALRVLAHLRHLRTLLVCLHGSLSSLFWSLFMLGTVYFLFSLLLVQVVTSHLIATDQIVEETVFYDQFGSIERSVLTLYKASTGGDDWSLAYDVIGSAGVLGSAIFVFFIAFVQFALINIITGIFVDSAMMVLKPDSETLAKEHTRQEEENALKLERLCLDVDADSSGKLTREQFEDGLQRRHIPMLLQMLGLQRHHVLEFFDFMAQAQDDDGQVQIDNFVNGCMLLKGPATNFDLQKLHAEFKASQVQLEHSLNDVMVLLRDALDA